MATIAEDARVLMLTRTFEAPAALLWEAWTDPSRATQWMGPPDYPAIHSEGDLRPGGRWRTCLRKPDGSPMWQGGEYREIDPPRRLVFTFAWDPETGGTGHETLVIVEFEERTPGRTTMHFRQAVFATIEQRDGHREGWTATFDRLETYLATLGERA